MAGTFGPHTTVKGLSYLKCNVYEGGGGCSSSRRIKQKCKCLADCTALNQNRLLDAAQTTLADHLCDAESYKLWSIYTFSTICLGQPVSPSCKCTAEAEAVL